MSRQASCHDASSISQEKDAPGRINAESEGFSQLATVEWLQAERFIYTSCTPALRDDTMTTHRMNRQNTNIILTAALAAALAGPGCTGGVDEAKDYQRSQEIWSEAEMARMQRESVPAGFEFVEYFRVKEDITIPLRDGHDPRKTFILEVYGDSARTEGDGLDSVTWDSDTIDVRVGDTGRIVRQGTVQGGRYSFSGEPRYEFDRR